MFSCFPYVHHRLYIIKDVYNLNNVYKICAIVWWQCMTMCSHYIYCINFVCKLESSEVF